MAKATHSTVAAAEETIEGFVGDLNQILHSAKTRAEGWLSQRQQIAKTLEGIRTTASNLLDQLGGGVSAVRASVKKAVRKVKRTRKRRGRKPGRPRKAPAAATVASAAAGKKPRTMSPEARERIAAAQRARWAKVKAAQKKK